MAEKQKLNTPIFRVSYPHLWVPQKSEDGKSDVYSVTMIFESDADLTELKKMCIAEKERKFGKNASGKFKKTFRPGTDDEFDLKKNPEYKDKIIAVARSYNRPVGVVRLDKSKPKGHKDRFPAITKQEEFYSGCYAIACVTAYGYDHPKGGRGVALGLQNIIKVKDGEPLVNISNPEDDFDEIDTDLFGDDTDIDNNDLFGDDDLDI
jgi:hypothetical protein